MASIHCAHSVALPVSRLRMNTGSDDKEDASLTVRLLQSRNLHRFIVASSQISPPHMCTGEARKGVTKGIKHSADNHAVSSKVYLNVYDIVLDTDPEFVPKINDYLFRCGMGVFHTGVEVWGTEYGTCLNHPKVCIRLPLYNARITYGKLSNMFSYPNSASGNRPIRA